MPTTGPATGPLPTLLRRARPADNTQHGMDDLVYSAHGVGVSARPAEEGDARFRALVQSPLRAGLLRFLNTRPGEAFDVDALMQAFGRLRLDVDNCVRELVDFGVARVVSPAGDLPRYAAARPVDESTLALLDSFLERRAVVSNEDQSP